MTQWFIFSCFLNCSLVNVSLSFQWMEALAAESKQEMKAFNIISTHWDEKVFWRTVWLFLAWKAEGGSNVKPSEESSLPSLTCAESSSLLPRDGRWLAPRGLCWLSSQKLLWETEVWGQRLDGAGERISRPGALATTSPWGFPKKVLRPGKGALEEFLQNSYRPRAFLEPYKWDGITSDQGQRVSLTVIDQS